MHIPTMSKMKKNGLDYIAVTDHRSAILSRHQPRPNQLNAYPLEGRRKLHQHSRTVSQSHEVITKQQVVD